MAQHPGPKSVFHRAPPATIPAPGAARALQRRDTPGELPGRKPGSASPMAEKKRVKHYYGLMERQLRRFYDMACRRPGHAGEALLLLCERRLDNVVRRAGLTHTGAQARLGIVHGHFLLSGRKVDRPSYLVRPGDVVSVRDRQHLRAFYRPLVHTPEPPAGWLQVEPAALRVTVTALPGPADISLRVGLDRLTEALTR